MAWEYRKRLCDVDSCRVVYSESDFLPGLIVDKFADVLSMQTLSLGMDMRKEMLARLLCEITGAKGVYERNDVPVRRHEGLEMQTGLLLGEVPERVEMRENGILYLVDVKHGQKTGFFLDQKQNRAAIAPLCPGRACWTASATTVPLPSTPLNTARRTCWAWIFPKKRWKWRGRTPRATA